MLRTLLLAQVVWLGAQLRTPLAAEVPADQPLAHDQLLWRHDPRGRTVAVRDAAGWEKRRAEILLAMQAVMGPLPGPAKRCALDVRVHEEVDCGDYVRRFLSYAPEPGGRVPAYLLVPKEALAGRETASGVLCLHQTHALGQKVVVGLGQSPDDEYGVELVRRGYVCLAPAYPLLAQYQPDVTGLGYQSGTMKAVWDNIRGLDLLEALPYVRPGRFGTIGHSLGGHNSVFTAAFDPRLKVVVSSCGLDAFRDYMDGNIRGWTSERYMPRLAQYRLDSLPFDFAEVLGLLAPRACLISAPFGDTNFKWRSVYRLEQAVAPVYHLYRTPEALRVVHPNCGHRFPPEIRAEAYALLDQVLRR